MERIGISYQEATTTPWEEIERAFFIWSLDSDRATLEKTRQEN